MINQDFFISFFKNYKFTDKDSSLIWALSLTNLALCANFNVDKVYWKDYEILDTVATINVLEFPPKESLSTKVSFESLNGTWVLCF